MIRGIAHEGVVLSQFWKFQASLTKFCLAGWGPWLITVLLMGVMVISPPVGAETILLSVEDDWPPYVHLEGRHRLEGLAIELVRAAFAIEGLKVQVSSLPLPRCLYYLEQAKQDACLNVRRSETTQAYLLADPPLFCEELMIYAPITNRSTGLGLRELRGKTVGYVRGSYYPQRVMTAPGVNFSVLDSEEQLLQLLAKQRIGLDYALLSRDPTEYRLAQEPELARRVHAVGSLGLEPFYLAFSSQHPQGRRLQQLFQRALSTLIADGRYAQMMGADRAQRLRACHQGHTQRIAGMLTQPANRFMGRPMRK